MTDLFDGSPVAIPFDHLSSPAHDLLPLPIDPWLASSLLQKSIRRGDADMAVRAALTLFRMRPGGIWRRFMVIAFEDVGAASIDAVVKAVAPAPIPDGEPPSAAMSALSSTSRVCLPKPSRTGPPITWCAAHEATRRGRRLGGWWDHSRLSAVSTW